MTIKDINDITQNEHNETAKALKVVAFGKTTGGAYKEVLVNASGVVQTA